MGGKTGLFEGGLMGDGCGDEARRGGGGGSGGGGWLAVVERVVGGVDCRSSANNLPWSALCWRGRRSSSLST